MDNKSDLLNTINANAEKHDAEVKTQYLEMAEKEDVLITKNGKVIARLVKPDDLELKLAALHELIGIANPAGKSVNITDEELKEMRINAGLEKYEDLG